MFLFRFTLGGYNKRGGDIFGLNYNMIYKSAVNEENLTYTPLLYGNGPGKLKEIRRYNLTDVQTKGKEYLQETAVYLKSETHGGEDVAVYASGPMSFLFDGLVIVTESSENRVNSDFDSKKSRLAIKLKFF